MLDGLEGADRAPELSPLLQVAHRLRQRGLHAADGLRGDGELPGSVQTGRAADSESISTHGQLRRDAAHRITEVRAHRRAVAGLERNQAGLAIGEHQQAAGTGGVAHGTAMARRRQRDRRGQGLVAEHRRHHRLGPDGDHAARTGDGLDHQRGLEPAHIGVAAHAAEARVGQRGVEGHVVLALRLQLDGARGPGVLLEQSIDGLENRPLIVVEIEVQWVPLRVAVARRPLTPSAAPGSAIVAIIIFPILGALIYLGTRSGEGKRDSALDTEHTDTRDHYTQTLG